MREGEGERDSLLSMWERERKGERERERSFIVYERGRERDSLLSTRERVILYCLCVCERERGRVKEYCLCRSCQISQQLVQIVWKILCRKLILTKTRVYYCCIITAYVLMIKTIVRYHTNTQTSPPGCRQSLYNFLSNCMPPFQRHHPLHSCLAVWPRSGELRTQKLRSRLMRTQSLNVLPLKPGVGQYIAIHATLTARDVLLAYFYLSGPFTCIFPKPLPIFPVLAVASTWFLCMPK